MSLCNSFHLALKKWSKKFHFKVFESWVEKMSVILKIDPSKKDIIINNNHNGITINNNNVSKREFPALPSNGSIGRNVDNFCELVMKTGSL